MSNDTHKADQIAFHFYTKLFYTVNHARATEDSASSSRVDKWFNLETPDSDLFTKEAREPYKSISLALPLGPPPLEIQVLLSIPELTNNQVLVYMSPDSSRVRIEPTPRYILLETWSLDMNTQSQNQNHRDTNTDVALPIIYKHGIVLFRSVFSLLRVLPAWKFYKRLKRRLGGVNRNHLAIKLRVRSPGDSETERHILGFDAPPSPTYRSPLPTATHTFPSVAHLLGTFTLSTTYLTTPNFQLDELESLLSSKFISLDLEGFIPTLDKNRQRDSISSSSLPNSSGIRSVMGRSPPRAMGRVTSGTSAAAASSSGGTGGSGGAATAAAAAAADSLSIAEKFIIPSRVPSTGPPSSLGTTASTGTSALIPPPRPFPTMQSPMPMPMPMPTSIPMPTPMQPHTQPIPASGLALHRLRRESLNSSSSSISTREFPFLSSSNHNSLRPSLPLLSQAAQVWYGCRCRCGCRSCTHQKTEYDSSPSPPFQIPYII
ncbi:autophagy-related protein 13-domain-containing protein [Gymnopilus junonius]|uniref:Autophagy-related protein 13 n=1 Tax=Gymnopilus junonius TaxID=109634 RepID=A0A9P5TNF0_GYMJU|nr:autophagy-related protein 13-domain-containing protein [Gymnopilus junonius]